MNRYPGFHWKTFFIAPLVVAGVVAALWLAVMAAYENIRFARATDQVLRLLVVARDVAAIPAISPEQSNATLLERLSHIETMHVQPASEDTAARLLNPWKREVFVALNPFLRQVRLQMSLSPSICRRMILFYVKDAPFLGVQKMEAHDEGSLNTTGRLLYDAANSTSQGKLDHAAIRAGCGESEGVRLMLTFNLQ